MGKGPGFSRAAACLRRAAAARGQTAYSTAPIAGSASHAYKYGMNVAVIDTLGLLAVAIFVASLARRLSLPYAVCVILAGMALAVARIDIGLKLTHDVIFYLVLPPLLFEATLNIRWAELRQAMVPVLILSMLGVIVSVLVVASGLVWFLAWPVSAAIAFGVLIAATDPMAIITMFKDLGIREKICLLLESESRCNTSIAAVLFGLVLIWSEGSTGESAEGSVVAFSVMVQGLTMPGLLRRLALLPATAKTQQR